MRPFMRIAGGGSRSTLSHNAIPRCSCERRQFHIQSTLWSEQQQKSAVDVAEAKAMLRDMTNFGADKKSSSKGKKETVDTQFIVAQTKITTPKIAKDILEKIKRPEKEASKKFVKELVRGSPEEIRAAVRRAVIEVYTHILRPKHQKEAASVRFQYSRDHDTPKVRITKDVATGLFKIDYGSKDVLNNLGKRQGKPSEFVPGDEHMKDDWTDLPIAEKHTKFAVFKRANQLLNFHIPDHILNSATTAGDLADKLYAHRPSADTSSDQKPRLAEQLTNPETKAGSILSDLSNVKIFKERMLRSDRELAIGRLATIPLIVRGKVEDEDFKTAHAKKLKSDEEKKIAAAALRKAKRRRTPEKNWEKYSKMYAKRKLPPI